MMDSDAEGFGVIFVLLLIGAIVAAGAVFGSEVGAMLAVGAVLAFLVAGVVAAFQGLR